MNEFFEGESVRRSGLICPEAYRDDDVQSQRFWVGGLIDNSEIE